MMLGCLFSTSLRHFPLPGAKGHVQQNDGRHQVIQAMTSLSPNVGGHLYNL